MNLIRRVFASAIGVALALALVQPIQAARFANAVCANDADGIYEFVQYRGWTREDVQQFVDVIAQLRTYGSRTCDDWSLRGAYVTIDGRLAWLVYVGPDLYILNFDPGGRVEGIS